MMRIIRYGHRSYMIKRLTFQLLFTVLASSLLVGCFNIPTVPTTTTAASSAATTATTSVNTPPPTRPAETTLTLRMEGGEEKVAAKLFTSDLRYSMYMETSRYNFSVTASQIDKSLSVDKFSPLERYTGMFLEIGHMDNITKVAALAKMQNALIVRFPTLTQGDDIGVGVDKLDALVLHGANGTSSDSEAFASAVFSDGGNGVYYYIINYYLMASEGYASRFNQYLDTFRYEAANPK